MVSTGHWSWSTGGWSVEDAGVPAELAADVSQYDPHLTGAGAELSDRIQTGNLHQGEERGVVQDEQLDVAGLECVDAEV